MDPPYFTRYEQLTMHRGEERPPQPFNENGVKSVAVS